MVALLVVQIESLFQVLYGLLLGVFVLAKFSGEVYAKLTVLTA
jgi:hypothetical protein